MIAPAAWRPGAILLLLVFLLAAPAPALPRRSAARPPRPRPTPAPLSAGERISVDLKDADIRDVLRSFAEMARVNLVVDPDVKGSVTVSLHDVAWVDALEVILRSNGLGMVASGRVLRVGSPARLSGEEAR
ncbi:MAG: hypothetical protein M3S32_00090 [Acidobacteriota bacterium]|nr:hypothetical protein [Acidobacteriota bacterium]